MLLIKKNTGDSNTETLVKHSKSRINDGASDAQGGGGESIDIFLLSTGRESKTYKISINK